MRHGRRPWQVGGAPGWPYKGRARFVRRAGLAFASVLVLSAIGVGTVLSAVLRASGIGQIAQLGGILLLGAAGLLLVLAVFFMGMRRLALPFGDIVGASERVSSGDFTVRLPEHGPPSMRAVSHAFNAMTTRLEENERRRQQYMSDIAHELRTPLTVIQGRLEGIIDGVYAPTTDQMKSLAGEARTLARLVEDLRALANAETGELSLRKEPTDIAALADDVAAGFDGQADVAVRVESRPLPIAAVDPVRLREALANLVVNAVHASPPRSVVTIRVGPQGDRVAIDVVDSGRGIARDRLPHIFERFYKDPGSRGSGLGLSIARSIVAAHGGTISAESAEGAGTTMTITLPFG